MDVGRFMLNGSRCGEVCDLRQKMCRNVQEMIKLSRYDDAKSHRSVMELGEKMESKRSLAIYNTSVCQPM